MTSVTADDAPVSAQVLDEAIAWQLRMEEGEGGADAEGGALQRWLAAHPDHARAWRQLHRLGAEMAASLAVARGPAVRQALVRPAARRPRRAAAVLAVALAVVVGCGVLDRFQPVTELLADHHTGTGERRSITLPDGTVLHLDTRSAVDVAFDASRRAIVLRAGQVAVETAHGSAERRPFVVLTDGGSLRALGTRFTVQALPGQAGATRVTVTQSAVAARPPGCTAAPDDDCAGERIVQTGQTALLHGGRVDLPKPAPPEPDAWKDGLLVVENQPLADVVEQLARYRPGRLAVDPRVASLRVTGTLPLRDTDQALLALTAAVPVEVAYTTRWWVTLEPRR
ncbi:FecR domain-containing protein [Oryzisolibacter sp. LB2S]|uniref:FecR domain-containing protein n=1 Tax=Alicycliphilus soli TaxID=3228789 RepID=UPI0034575710